MQNVLIVIIYHRSVFRPPWLMTRFTIPAQNVVMSDLALRQTLGYEQHVGMAVPNVLSLIYRAAVAYAKWQWDVVGEIDP